MLPAFLAVLAPLSITGPRLDAHRLADHAGDARYHGGSSIARTDLVVARQLIPGDFGYAHGDEYDTARLERAISDSGRAADSARGDLCPRVCPTVAKPLPLPQLVARAAVAPTSCSSYACRRGD